MNQTDKKQKRKSRISTAILIVIFLIGLSLLLYPTVSDYWNSLHQSRTIASYVEAVENLDDQKYQEILDNARDYNTRLYQNKIGLSLPSSWESEYNSQLNVGGDGVMGYISIEKIDLKLAIYHGTDDAVLQTAVGHIEGSSLPVGGESTHCVLSGHRGLPSATLFSNLDQMEVGDTFVLQILDETLTYQVDLISIVLPNETQPTAIEEGEDLCTLLTCTPYGVNSHRLLVRGHRIENQVENNVRVTSDGIQVEPLIVASVGAAPVLLLLLLVALIAPGRKKKSGDENEK